MENIDVKAKSGAGWFELLVERRGTVGPREKPESQTGLFSCSSPLTCSLKVTS